MTMRIGAAVGALVFACVLATGCGPGLDDDMKTICSAGGSGQVVGVSSLEAKEAGLKAYLRVNVKSEEGKAFATDLMATPNAEKAAKLEAAVKAAEIDPNRCSTLALLKKLPAAEE